MEIRECLSVYLESGYLFDDMSGRLKWFEIDKILISFTYGVVRYVGTWGGCRTEKTLDGKSFYSSEECFKKGESIPKTRLSIYDVFESLYGFIPIGDVWKYKNGRAVKDKLEYFDIEIDDKGKIYCKETYYRTREDVYKFNDLTVVDRNGDIRLVGSSKSRLIIAYNGILMNYWDVYDCMDEVEEPTDDDWLNAVSNLFDSYTYDIKNTDVDKFKMSDVMNVYRIINL